MRKVSLALAAALSIGAATQAFASPVDIFFDTTPVTLTGTLNNDFADGTDIPYNPPYTVAGLNTVAVTMSNPSITMNVGDTKVLNIWAQFNNSNSSDIINSLGLDIDTSNAGIVHATSDSIPYVLVSTSSSHGNYTNRGLKRQ